MHARLCPTLWPHRLQSARLLCPWDSQAKILEWVAISSSRGSSRPRDQTQVSRISCTGRWILCHVSHQGSPSPALSKLQSRACLYHFCHVSVLPELLVINHLIWTLTAVCFFFYLNTFSKKTLSHSYILQSSNPTCRDLSWRCTSKDMKMHGHRAFTMVLLVTAKYLKLPKCPSKKTGWTDYGAHGTAGKGMRKVAVNWYGVTSGDRATWREPRAEEHTWWTTLWV